MDGITDSMETSLSKLRESGGHGGLACCSPWGHRELATTERLDSNNCNLFHVYKAILLPPATMLYLRSQNLLIF